MRWSVRVWLTAEQALGATRAAVPPAPQMELSMEQMLEELKREDAESAEDEARRRRKEEARARAAELQQRKKAAENAALKKRKTAEKKAKERHELEELQAARRAKELARREKKEARRRKAAEEPEWAQPPPEKEEWELPQPAATEKLERLTNKALRWLQARQGEAIVCVCFALLAYVIIAEWRNPSKRRDQRNIYAVPINGPATADAAEWTCSYRGLKLITHSAQHPATRETLDTAWRGGCSSQTIQSFAGEFCGDCSNSAPEGRCQNLAVWWSGNSPSEFSTGQIAGNPDGVFSWDVSGRVDMKALCIEKDLKPENHPVILDKNYDRVDRDTYFRGSIVKGGKHGRAEQYVKTPLAKAGLG